MSKPRSIRWRPSDEEELRKAVKNFNAKLSRLAKKDPQKAAALPERASVKQLRELIHTRQDLNREINSLRRFSKKGAEEIVIAPDNKYNLEITKWQRYEMNLRKSIINRKRKKRFDEVMSIEAESQGVKLGYTRGQIGMGSIEKNSLLPINAFTPSMNRADLNMKHRALMKESQDDYWEWRDTRMKEGYIKGLAQNYNPNDVKDIIDAIRQMDFKEFRRIVGANGGRFEEIYFPNQNVYWDYVTGLRAQWLPESKPKGVK